MPPPLVDPPEELPDELLAVPLLEPPDDVDPPLDPPDPEPLLLPLDDDEPLPFSHGSVVAVLPQPATAPAATSRLVNAASCRTALRMANGSLGTQEVRAGDAGKPHPPRARVKRHEIVLMAVTLPRVQ